MPTWADLVRHARDKYTLSRDEDELFALVFSFPDGRSQQVFCKRFEAFDRECVEIRSPVCGAEEMVPAEALEKNAEFALGALALEAGMYFMMHNVLLRDLDLEQFDLQIQVIAACADDLEQEHTDGDEY